MLRFHHLIVILASLASSAFAQRVAWTTPRVTGSPDPPARCATERVYPNITFSEPLEIIAIPDPGWNRLAVAQRNGKLFTFTHDSRQPDLLADLRQYNDEVRECYSFAFHPRFAENRLVFVWANLDGKGRPNREDGTHILRFRMKAHPAPGKPESDPPLLDLSSGKKVLSFLSGGHNGGAIRFGPDGMLYISIGDGEVPEPPDPRVTGQDISDLGASILRIDVDHEDGDRPYRIPADNPFVKMKEARGEVWAYGFRNPWRISFDPFTGNLFAGDVGWELWEAIHHVTRGGNYGWSITEMSRQPVRPDRKRGPTPILPPAAAHSHEEAMSITGGETYRGKQMPDLRGNYIYGDWETGRVWSLHMTGEKHDTPQPPVELCDTTLKIISFGTDHDGEMLILDFVGGGIHRLINNPDQAKTGRFPRTLSETGLFADVKKRDPAPGVLPYDVRAARWADHATGQRLLALPGMERITNARKEDGILPAGRWVFPKDGVLTKTYSLELERGKPETSRRVETQMMHWNGQTWNAYTYKWNAAQTDAELVGTGGDEETFDVVEKDGEKRKQTWRFHGRAECQRCHNAWVNYTPGFNKPQLETSDAKKLAALREYIDEKLPAESPLVNPHDTKQPLESRARSYLHANCSSCHRFGGGGSVPMVLNIDAKLEESRLINVKPVLGDMSLTDARLITPGVAAGSVLIYRMATTGQGHMPYAGSRLIDDQGLLLLRNWIDAMKAGDEQAIEHAALTRAVLRRYVEAIANNEPPRSDDAAHAEQELAVALAIADGTLTGRARQRAIGGGGLSFVPLRRDLLDRFLPDDKRRITLGDRIDLKSLLALKGDADRGKALFFAPGGARCATCHRVAAEGTEFGPDLTKIAGKYKREEILDHILAPSKRIDDAWKLTLVETSDGEILTGFVLRKAETAITLRIAGGKEARIALKQIAAQHEQTLSAMPEGLLRGMTAQEAADLLDYLATLK